MPHVPLRLRLAAVLAGLVTLASGLVSATPAQAANVATPGNFTGYGFDQCVAPNQAAMDAWLRSSPFWAVGIYISGDSRACPVQPNLTPTWVSTQIANGWRLLPITLGPQAWCTTRERYLQQVRIKPDPAGGYAAALRPGPGRGRQDRAGRDGAGARRGQHALVRPRGRLQHQQDRLPRVGADLPLRLDDPAARARLPVGLLLQRRHGHQDARRRRDPAARRLRDARPAVGGPLERHPRPDQRARHDLPARQQLDPAQARPPVPRRPQRDPRRRDHQHRQQLRRPGHRLGRAGGQGALRRRPGRLPRLRQAQGRLPGRPGQGRAVPAAHEEQVRRRDHRGLRRRDRRGGEGLPRQGRAARPGRHVEGGVDLDPREGRAPADEVRRGQPRRTPPAAGAQRRRPGRARGDRRVRGEHHRRGEGVPGRQPAPRHRRGHRRDVGGSAREAAAARPRFVRDPRLQRTQRAATGWLRRRRPGGSRSRPRAARRAGR